MNLIAFTSVAICLIAIRQTDAATGGDWDYDTSGANGPDNWGEDFPICNEKSQSPINIVRSAVIYKADLPQLKPTNYEDTMTGNFTVENTGKTVLVTLPIAGSTSIPSMEYNDTTYELAQFHFHWGSSNSRGSEHTVDGKKYPAEVHFVHWNKNYTNLTEAVNKTDGLLVWGFIIDIGNTNTAFDELLGSFSEIMYKGNSTEIDPFVLQSLLPAETERTNYFTYKGSLTTPTCDQSVRWIVNQKPIKMSSSQIAMFRDLYSGNDSSTAKIEDTYRPVQDLNGRMVYSNVAVDNSHYFLEETGYNYITDSLRGPSHWKSNYPLCGKSKQSPIDIVNTVYNSSLPKLKRTKYNEDISGNYLIENNGHSVTVKLLNTNSVTVSYNGGTYYLAQFHFHSGTITDKGSEHRLDGKSYQAEVHFVHFNKKYSTFAAALAADDGLLVNGFFMKADEDKKNAGYEKVFSQFDKVQHKNDNSTFSYFPVGELIPEDSDKYYTYSGSLTTPTCNEAVTWIVSSKVIIISKEQMKKFSTLYKTEKNATKAEKLENNYRPVEALNKRVIQTNVESSAAQSLHNLFTAIMVGFVVMFSYHLF